MPASSGRASVPARRRRYAILISSAVMTTAIALASPATAVGADLRAAVPPGAVAASPMVPLVAPDRPALLLKFVESIGLTGMWVDSEATVAHIRVPLGRALSSDETAALRGFGLDYTLEPTTVTTKDFDTASEVVDQVARDSKHAYSVGWGYAPESDTLSFRYGGPMSDLDAVKTTLPAFVKFDSESVTAVSGSRKADQNPHLGGASIAGGGELCTAGVAVRDTAGGHTAIVTASHCGPQGADFTSELGGFAWGQVVAIDQGTMRRSSHTANDVDLIQRSPTYQSYTGRLYKGSTTTTSSMPVEAASAPVAGDPICFSGRTSGTQCTLTVIENVGYSCYPGGWSNDTCSRLFKMGYTGQNVQGGDSGGPLYKEFSYGTGVAARIKGITAAASTNFAYGVGWDDIVDSLDYLIGPTTLVTD